MRTVKSDLATSGTVDLDFEALHDTIQLIKMEGDLTFNVINDEPGYTLSIVFFPMGSNRTVTWPWSGDVLPTTIVDGEAQAVTLTTMIEEGVEVIEPRHNGLV